MTEARERGEALLDRLASLEQRAQRAEALVTELRADVGWAKGQKSTGKF